MRVLHISTEYPPLVYGGLGTAVGGLTTALAREGVEVGMLVVGRRNPYGERAPETPASRAITIERRAGVTIFWCEWLTIETAIRLVRWWRPDVVHLHAFWLSPFALAIRTETGTRLVYHIHSLDRAEYEIGAESSCCMDQWPTQRQIISLANRVIALCDDERRLLCTYVPEALQAVEIIGNGIDDVEIAPERRDPDAVTILFTGRFVNRKGIHELLTAIGPVLRANPRARFILAGGQRGQSADDVRRWWLPIAGEVDATRVRFTGWMDELSMTRLYREADILVVPSWYEPFGMVVLEGMLHGLAIVSTKAGGPAEILTDEETALMVPLRDSNALATALIRLCADAALRGRLGGAAAIDVRRRWLWSAIAPKFVAMYRRAMAA